MSHVHLQCGALAWALLSVAPCLAQTSSPSSELSSSDWTSLHAAYEDARHRVFTVEGGFEARSFAQAYITRFDGRGVRVTPDRGDWELGLELASYGRDDARRDTLEPVAVHPKRRSLEYAWSDEVTEWYVNGGDGIEHGFTVSERPEGEGDLRFELRVLGGLDVRVHADGLGAGLFDSNGELAATYDGLVANDRTGRELSSWMTSEQGGLVLHVHDAGATYPLTIDPVLQTAYLKSSNTIPTDTDNFGYSIAVSGDTVVVGAPFEDSNATGVDGSQANNFVNNSGAAYVFVRAGSNWSQQAYLKASNTGSNDEFGWSVAVSGDTVVVGALLERSSATSSGGDQADNSANAAGAAYVFVRSGSTWSQEAYLKASNSGAGDTFGSSVSISGETIVVGAPGEDSIATGVGGNEADNGLESAGAAYVFVRTGPVWTQEAYLKASNTGGGDQFGRSVSIDGDTVIACARFEDSSAIGVNGNQADNSSGDSGAAYVFVRFGSTWFQEAYLKAHNTEAFDEFGSSVAVSGDSVVVGAFHEDSNATGVNGNKNDNSSTRSGAAYVFVRSGSTWSQQAYLKASNTDTYDEFGFSVAVSGDTVVVGSRWESSTATGVDGNQADNSAIASGATYVFVRSGSIWSQQAYLKASNTGPADDFGFGVAVSGDTVVVSAYREDSSATGVNGNQTDNGSSESGAAYVFVRSGSTWSQQAYLKAANTDSAFDYFGSSVAVSGDTVVVGADREDSSATGVNGNQADNSAGFSGAAYVFVRSGSTWSQQAYLKASNTDALDGFGASVAVSGDTVVVGSRWESSTATGVNGNQADNSASYSGAAYVFVRSGSNWTQEAYLKASNTDVEDMFGSSVAVSGDTVVVGAFLEGSTATGVDGNQADNSAFASGAAYVFVRSGSIWSQQAYLKASNTDWYDYFGSSVAVSGDTVVVGASLEESNATGVNGNPADNSLGSAGAAYVFVRFGSTWFQQAYLKASNTDAGDEFGTSVAVSDDTVVVGALDEDSNATGVNGNQFDNSAIASGAAYVFVRSGSTWSQQAYLKASNTDAIDQFGSSVAVSGDTVVVSAFFERSNATGVNGSQADNSLSESGAAYVFARSGSAWVQQAYLKASNTGGGDIFGRSVAVSGGTVVIGATGEDSNATGVDGDQFDNSSFSSGAVYIFELGFWTVIPGCHGNTAHYVRPTTAARINTTVPVSLLGSVVDNGIVATYYGAKGVDGLGCGTQLSGTEELVLALAPFPTFYTYLVMSGGVATLPLSIPNDPGLVGFQVTLQSVAIDTTTFASEFSDGLEFEIVQ